MKYIIRSLKYFCYLIVLLTVIILALVLTGFVEGLWEDYPHAIPRCSAGKYHLGYC